MANYSELDHLNQLIDENTRDTAARLQEANARADREREVRWERMYN